MKPLFKFKAASPIAIAILLISSGGVLGLISVKIAHLVAVQHQYRLLETALQRQDWLTSDRLTQTIVLKLSGETTETTPRSLAQLPCRDLQALDRLWQTYSQNRFGFAPQHRIWQIQGAQVSRSMDQQMATVMGWHTPDSYPGQAQRFDLTAPPGHLPFYLYCCLSWDPHKSLWFMDDRVVISTLAQRYDQCQG